LDTNLKASFALDAVILVIFLLPWLQMFGTAAGYPAEIKNRDSLQLDTHLKGSFSLDAVILGIFLLVADDWDDSWLPS